MNYSFHRVAEHSKARPIVEGDVPRCPTTRFPYRTLYSEEPDGIFVLAVMHLHRASDYWRHRL